MRTTVFITHAAPEDNDFALWLSSKLATAGYRVWVDKQRLRGGDDFWDEIDRILRNDAIKQIVVFTTNCAKAGVKRELAIGSIVAQRLSDPKFMIPIRADNVRFTDAPPEFVRGNILDAYPHWFNCPMIYSPLFLRLLYRDLHRPTLPSSTPLLKLGRTVADLLFISASLASPIGFPSLNRQRAFGTIALTARKPS